MFRELDHVAVLVGDTEEALRLYRDRLGLNVLLSEVVAGGAVRLTHLDLGGTQLQLVEPLSEAHPLHADLRDQGPGLHHLCFAVADVDWAMTTLRSQGFHLAQDRPHQGVRGKRAVFLDRQSTGGLRIEVTGK